jgi:hypothetical protein
MADFIDKDTFDDFVAKVKATESREVVISVRTEIMAKRVGTHSFVAQPMLVYQCVAEIPDTSSHDPFATTQVTWETTVEAKSGADEQSHLDRIVKALRARGFSVAVPTGWR